MPSQPVTIGKYRILGRLGSGGMSTVYRAHDPDRDIDVAIKLLQDDNPGNDTVLRFQREARAAARLNHPNVARVLDFGSADGKLYLVMELAPGQSLTDLIHRNGPLTINEALPVFEKIASGLAHAHGNGVLHRDIKPSNIMLEEGNGEALVKIVDFGIARLMESDEKLTISGANIGSPLYMSPEQAGAGSVEERSDIYSLGCLMYECLSGVPPFRGDTAVATMMMHRNDTPPPLFLEEGETGARLETLIRQCLEKKPGNRPATMDTLKTELERVAEESTGVDVETPDSKLGTDHRSRSRVRAAMPFLVVLAVLAIAFYIGIAAIESPQPPEAVNEHDSTSTLIADLEKEDQIKISDEGKTALLKEDATDKDIERLKCPPLTHLKIMSKNITPNGLKRIARLPLTHLTLEDTRFESSSLARLAGISGLQSLCLIHNQNIDDNAIETISTFNSFGSLELYDCPVTDRGMKVISEKLDLSGLLLRDLDKVSARGLESMKDLEKLDYLSVQLNHLPPEAVVKAITRSTAQDICIIDLPVGKNELRFFADNQVRSLLMDRARKDSALVLGQWKALMNLSINADKFDQDDIESIAAIKTLNLLKLTNGHLKSADVEALAGSSVTGLVLESCNLDSKMLMHLVESPRLARVDLERCGGIAPAQFDDFKNAYQNRWKKPLEGRFEEGKEHLEDLIIQGGY